MVQLRNGHLSNAVANGRNSAAPETTSTTLAREHLRSQHLALRVPSKDQHRESPRHFRLPQLLYHEPRIDTGAPPHEQLFTGQL